MLVVFCIFAVFEAPVRFWSEAGLQFDASSAEFDDRTIETAPSGCLL